MFVQKQRIIDGIYSFVFLSAPTVGTTCDIETKDRDVDMLNDRYRARGLDWLKVSHYMLTLK